MTIYGRAAGGGPYAALAALTNIPATLLAAAFFELVLRDGERTVTPEWLAFLGGKRAEAARKNGEELVQRLLKRAETSGRADDTEEVIRERQDLYVRETAPLAAAYTERGLLVQVDGMGSIDEVEARIGAALDEVAAKN